MFPYLQMMLISYLSGNSVQLRCMFPFSRGLSDVNKCICVPFQSMFLWFLFQTCSIRNRFPFCRLISCSTHRSKCSLFANSWHPIHPLRTVRLCLPVLPFPSTTGSYMIACSRSGPRFQHFYFLLLKCSLIPLVQSDSPTMIV